MCAIDKRSQNVSGISSESVLFATIKKSSNTETGDFIERATCIKRLFWPPYEAKILKLCLTNLLLLVY